MGVAFIVLAVQHVDPLHGKKNYMAMDLSSKELLRACPVNLPEAGMNLVRLTAFWCAAKIQNQKMFPVQSASQLA